MLVASGLEPGLISGFMLALVLSFAWAAVLAPRVFTGIQIPDGPIWSWDEEQIETDEYGDPIKPTTGKAANRNQWIKYLAMVKAIPVWDEKLQPFPVFFRRLTSEREGDHLKGLGKKTRQRVAEILGIKTKEDCKRVQEKIRSRFDE